MLNYKNLRNNNQAVEDSENQGAKFMGITRLRLAQKVEEKITYRLWTLHVQILHVVRERENTNINTRS